jgi:hypothetical protein
VLLELGLFTKSLIILLLKARAERDELQSTITKLHHQQHSIEQDFKEQ